MFGQPVLLDTITQNLQGMVNIPDVSLGTSRLGKSEHKILNFCESYLNINDWANRHICNSPLCLLIVKPTKLFAGSCVRQLFYFLVHSTRILLAMNYKSKKPE